ncbi:Histone deacetylase HDT3 [Zea mays]|uniref:Histone deacetylase HDT3 n=1 Tax=Zea mays TaxID=4577 RepID=A0A3L6DRQ8_MAIZE|nr:Histone deacetylase HDT3 [Zea mays]
MEFWGEEVKPGATVSCKVGDGLVIHLSQAALGEPKKASENAIVSVKIDDKKLVLGTLSVEKHPQISCDLVPVKVGIQNADEDETSSGDDDDFTDSDSEMSEEDESSDEDEVSSDTDTSDDSGSEEQTPTPKKTEVVVGKKRAIEAETPSGKKAKSEQSAQKTGDKVSTSHPAKQSSKTPADKSTKTPTADKKSPKSGSHACKSCSKSFGSASALESHQKAKKHEA